MDPFVIAALIVIVVGAAWMLFGRHHQKTGGITERSMEGRASSGREGASEPSDRDGARTGMSQHGTR